jgi:hypothetical protein
MNEPHAGADRSGTLLANYVKGLVDEERKHGNSLESRGRAVISSAGALVTLLLALAAVGSKTATVVVPTDARAFVGAAVGFFALAAAMAVATAAPQSARLVNPDTFNGEVRAAWARPADAALKRITATRIQELTDAQRTNTWKAVLLLAAVGAEAVAVLCLAIAVIWTVA